MDEIAAPHDADGTDAPAAAAGAKGPVRAYCPAVLAERQPRFTDLIPVRPLAITMLALLALTGVAAIETIHIYARTLPGLEGLAQLAALDATQRGSLAAWYSSALLAGAAVLATAVYAIRVHRVDDYSGKYRIWLWAAAALALASLDAATGMHEALGLAVTTLAGGEWESESLAAACTLAWLAVYALAFGTLAIRLAIEVWPSLASFTSLATAGLFYFLAGLMQLAVLPVASPLVASVVESGLAMLAHLTLAMSVAFYARHVHLDAQGRLKVHIDPARNKKAKPRGRAKLKVVPSDDSTSSAEEPQPATTTSTQPRFGSSSAPKSSAAISKSSGLDESDEVDDDDDEYGEQKLSKADRRRMKKLARRDAQRRAA